MSRLHAGGEEHTHFTLTLALTLTHSTGGMAARVLGWSLTRIQPVSVKSMKRRRTQTGGRGGKVTPSWDEWARRERREEKLGAYMHDDWCDNMRVQPHLNRNVYQSSEVFGTHSKSYSWAPTNNAHHVCSRSAVLIFVLSLIHI